MHTAHLGVYAWLLGSILALLTHHAMPQSPAENLRVLRQALRAAYQSLGVQIRFNDLSLKMYFKADAFP
eukprot:9538244-Alexandrium_andersonii.AAC.1